MNALCVKLLWLASCFCILCLSQDFFTAFCTVAKAAREEICNDIYAVVQGASCKKIGCASAFSNLAGAEKVFVVLWVCLLCKRTCGNNVQLQSKPLAR